MSANDVEVPNAGPNRPRLFQFSIRTMFIATAALVVVMSGIFTPIAPVQVLTAYAVLVVMPVVLVTVLIYSRDYRRTFAIGALFPAGGVFYGGTPAYMLYGGGNALSEPTIVLIALVAYLFLICVCGMVAVGVRRMVEMSEWPAESPTTSTDVHESEPRAD